MLGSGEDFLEEEKTAEYAEYAEFPDSESGPSAFPRI
jgi:hypothetical protein